MMRTTLGILVGAGVFAFGGSALAAPTSAVDVADTSDGYAYIYDADLLNADGFGTTIPIIKVRKRHLRRTLIKPRASFVPELLGSTDGL